MANDFKTFGTLVNTRFNAMAKGDLFVVGADSNDIWEAYLAAFPEGTNPVFRERTEHDCSCCKNFVRNIGNIVTIEDGDIGTIWDVADAPYPYDVVAGKMAEFVRSHSINNVCAMPQASYGAKVTRELIDGRSHAWDHFHGTLPARFVRGAVAEFRGKTKSVADVFQRGLEELDVSAFDTVLDLIKDNLLYRGAEFKRSVSEFRKMAEEYRKINDPAARALYVWKNINSPAARFRNTVIGTLVQDLSEGVSLEDAVKKFEGKVAPENYKRPKALITPRMIKDAVATLKTLGLEDSVNRRFATIADVSVNDVLFVDNEVQEQMKDGLEGLLMEAVSPKQVSIDNPFDILVDEFVTDVLPKAKYLDLLVENKNLGNFVSLTAPKNEDTGGLFKWGNDFAWSYDGDVADSLKEKVKAAGGDVEAELRVSLGWYCNDDLDLHCYAPDRHIYYGDKYGILDLDMNGMDKHDDKEPVENMRWKRMPKDGVYNIIVDNYSRRSGTPGFELEVECMGTLYQYTYDKVCGHRMQCLSLTIKGGKLESITASKSLSGGSAQARTIGKWGVNTQTLSRVDTLMLSPNHWGDQEIGNKHWFFILKDCKNPEPARGIYNEFLKPGLEKHRKVFEVLGSKTKCEPTDDQLSGLGFSGARKDTAIVVAKGPGLNRAYNIVF